MKRDHEFHTEGTYLFPPPDTLNELALPPGSTWTGTQIEVESFGLEPYELRGVQGYIDYEKLSDILVDSKDEEIEAIFDAIWTLVTGRQGGQEGIARLGELEQQMVERADALDSNVFVALPPSAGGLDLIASRLPELVAGDFEVGSISDHARKSAGGDADRAPDNVFVSNFEVPPVSELRLSSVLDGVADGREGSSESFWTKDVRPYQSMLDAEVQIVTSLDQPFEQRYAVIAA
ncbi:hypothetical protein [Roseateles sp.]|uniref:hypothetical protein n=1 Tax=Roseateles sp. TaxID=1971397 RepID=UPI0031DFB8A9